MQPAEQIFTARSTSSVSLSYTPLTKRNKLSTRKNRSQSPRDVATTSDQSSPLHSPIVSTLSRTPSQQSMPSPLSNSTNNSSLSSTPNRNWLSSQEPPRDILWDNTSPVNSRGKKGIRPGFSSIQELCKSWSVNSVEDVCPSQKSALSDKWLSMKNDVIGSNGSEYTRLQNNNNSNKQESPARSHKRNVPSKHLSSLLELLQKPKLKGTLNFENIASEESTDDKVLAPNSDPAQNDGNSSLDDLWGEEDNSFLFKASQCLDIATSSPVKNDLVTVIPSTLSSENCTNSTSSASNKTGCTQSGTSSAELFPGSNSFTSLTKTQNRFTQIKSKNCMVRKESNCPVLVSSSISCTNFYDQSVTTNQSSRIPLTNISKKLQRNSSNGKLGIQGKEKIEVITLDEENLTGKIAKPQIGMPGLWLSQASCASVNSKTGMVEETQKDERSSRNHQKRLTRIQNLSSKNQATLNCTTSMGISSKKTFEMPVVLESQTENDNEDFDWGNLDSDIYSQENIELFDKVIELKEKQLSQCFQQYTSNNSPASNLPFNKMLTKNLNTSEDTSQNSQVIGSGNSGEVFSGPSSLESDSSKKKCSRIEINRKKAEALRRRRQREETQCKSNLNFIINGSLGSVCSS